MTGIPPIDQSLLPTEVRNGSADDRKQYAAALGFERTLMGELAKAMADTAKPADGEDADQSGDAASSMYLSMLPDQLADSLQQNGGLGLAKTFYDSMKEQGQ
jgi:Rod binding domain-containing protein